MCKTITNFVPQSSDFQKLEKLLKEHQRFFSLASANDSKFIPLLKDEVYFLSYGDCDCSSPIGERALSDDDIDWIKTSRHNEIQGLWVRGWDKDQVKTWLELESIKKKMSEPDIQPRARVDRHGRRDSLSMEGWNDLITKILTEKVCDYFGLLIQDSIDPQPQSVSSDRIQMFVSDFKPEYFKYFRRNILYVFS